MMKTRLILHHGLFALLLAACAPQAATAFPPETLLPEPTATQNTDDAMPSPIPTLDQMPQSIEGATQVLDPTPFPIATSRGPDLEATDPSTVSLASGNPHFVEFFRFT